MSLMAKKLASLTENLAVLTQSQAQIAQVLAA